MTLTWNNQPADGAVLARWAPGAADDEVLVPLPADLLRQAWDQGQPLSLVIRQDSGSTTPVIAYASREDADPARRPDLLIATEPVDPPVVALAPASIAASGAQDGNPPENAFDGDLETRWSQQGLNEWLAVDAGGEVSFAGADIAFYLADQRFAYFELHVSADGAAWTPVLTSGQSSGASLQPQRFLFPAATARYLRYVGLGNSVNTWNSLTEFAALVEIPRDRDGNGLADDWEAHHFGADGQQADLDPDGNGLNRLQEYGMGLAPDAGAVEPPLRLDSEGRLTFYARAAAGPGYGGLVRRYEVEWTETLTPPDWQPAPGAPPIDGFNRQHEVLLPGPPSPNAFYRLRIRLD